MSDQNKVHQIVSCPECGTDRGVTWEYADDYAWARMSESCWCDKEITAYGTEDVRELLAMLRVENDV